MTTITRDNTWVAFVHQGHPVAGQIWGWMTEVGPVHETDAGATVGRVGDPLIQIRLTTHPRWNRGQVVRIPEACEKAVCRDWEDAWDTARVLAGWDS